MKPRISYSIIRYWLIKDYEKMVESYFHLQQIDTIPMQEGRTFDEEECDYVSKNSRFSDRLGGGVLTNPVTQDKWEVEAPTYTLVGKPDVYDDTRIFEIKTGKKNSADYAKTLQLKLYLLLSYLKKQPRNIGFYLHYNLKRKAMDWHMVIVNKEEMEKTFHKVDKYCLDIVNYLETQGLI
jgi:CRISPR/Cas system-associated exonuclease Cas4 (RecB family)